MSVSGAWKGMRRRPGRLVDTSFLATLVESPRGMIHGMIEEEDPEAGTIYASVEGHRRGEMVIFVATVENPSPEQRPIQFIGMAAPGDGAVKGTWILATTIRGDRYGEFEMEKLAQGVAEASETPVFEPV